MNYYSDKFETQIHIQTQIRKSFILALATNDFLEILLKYRKDLQTQIIDRKTSLQKSVILPIIRGVSPT